MTHLYVDGQIAAITIESGHIANVDIYSTLSPNTKYLIKNITTFPDTLLATVTTDEFSYSTTPILFSNNTGNNITIELQAFEDKLISPDSTNTVQVTITPKGISGNCPKGDWYNAPYIGDCDPGYSRQLFGSYCVCDKGTTKPPTDYATLAFYGVAIISGVYILGKVLERKK